jgi:hypothetical protein
MPSVLCYCKHGGRDEMGQHLFTAGDWLKAQFPADLSLWGGIHNNSECSCLLMYRYCLSKISLKAHRISSRRP